MKVTCEIVPQDWDCLIPALNTNKFDAILSSMQITDERKKAVDFTNKYYNIPSLGYEHFDFNTTKAPFNDVRVRQAVAYALDRDAINKSIFAGAITFITP